MTPLTLQVSKPVDLGKVTMRTAQDVHARELILDAIERGGQLVGQITHEWAEVPPDTGRNTGSADDPLLVPDPLGATLEGVGPWLVLTSHVDAEVEDGTVAREARGTLHRDPLAADLYALAQAELALAAGGCEQTRRHTFTQVDAYALSEATLDRALCLACRRIVMRAELLEQAAREAAGRG